MTEVVGWASSGVLLLTIIAQIKKQWTSRSTRGVSKWLFLGQALAWGGFIAYSVLSSNTVFIVTNAMLLLSSLVGVYIYFRDR